MATLKKITAVIELNKVNSPLKPSASLEINGAETPASNNPLAKSELKLASNFAWAGLKAFGID